jgi:hypothetical protein
MAILYKSNIDLGGLQLQNAAIHPTDTAPSSPSEGQIYFNTAAGDKKVYVWDGTVWQDVSGDVRSISSGALNTMYITSGSGGDAVIELNHLGIENLVPPVKNNVAQDGIMFYDASGSGTQWLTPSTGTGIRINSTSLELYEIPNASLENDSVTVTKGNGLTSLSGGTMALGGSVTITVGQGTGIAVETNGVALKNHANLTDNTILMWDDTGGQLVDSSIADDGTTVSIGTESDSRNLVVSGNLTVSGTTTTVDSNTVNIGDSILTLNADIAASATPSEDAGFEVDRGSETNVSFLWKEGANPYWSVGGELRIETINTESSVTVGDQVLLQSTTSGQTVKRASVSAIGNALGLGGHSILLNASQRDHVTKSGNTYTVTHSLGSKLVHVQIVDATTYETVFVEVARTTVNAVEVRFADTVADGDYICMTSLIKNLDEANGIAT